MKALAMAYQLINHPHSKASLEIPAGEMLRKQDAAIKQLREALEAIKATKPQHGMNPNAYMSDPDDIKVGWNVHWVAHKALAATEEFQE